MTYNIIRKSEKNASICHVVTTKVFGKLPSSAALKLFHVLIFRLDSFYIK